MELTWRWFGKNDRIGLRELKSIGVEGIVTALHGIANGEVWPEEEIVRLRDYIAGAGLRWSVVESLPVSEGIKWGSPDRDRLLENYRVSLEHLGRAGIRTVCYNFMPVIDWIRTDLLRPTPEGNFTLYFDRIRFAYFDCRILTREGAERDYTQQELAAVEELAATVTEEERERLVDTIIVKTQGFINGNIREGDRDPVSLFRQLLSRYEGIDRDRLRANFKYFMEAVAPMAERYGIGLCVHPDDPPYQVLGLPRIVTGREDIDWLLSAVDSPANGLTFCAGSLSSGLHNDVPELAGRYADRTHFVHLRSTDAFDNGNFVEAPHTEGRGRLVEVIRVFEKRRPEVPMRVDHGLLMPGDVGRGDNPGYSFLGRMYALGEVRGMMAAVRKEIEEGRI